MLTVSDAIGQAVKMAHERKSRENVVVYRMLTGGIAGYEYIIGSEAPPVHSCVRVCTCVPLGDQVSVHFND